MRCDLGLGRQLEHVHAAHRGVEPDRGGHAIPPTGLKRLVQPPVLGLVPRQRFLGNRGLLRGEHLWRARHAQHIVAGTCIDNAGKIAGASVPVHYDATPPTITSGLPTRPPDHNGWYTHPVSFAFNGTDATSGVSGCTNTTYAGPSSASASVVGSCVDRAGNIARMAVPLHYDSTGPSLAVSTGTGDGFVALEWKTGADVAPLASIEVARKPGRRGPDSSVVYRGKAGDFRDVHVGNRKRYRYTITATDQAGNESTRVIGITAGPHLISPADGARVGTRRC